jgi:fructokinase
VGEVLFDQFPDGQRVLGGAPFNVAWNLQGFGLSPLFVSAVGNDEEGAEIRERMTRWGMDTSALQTTSAWPTGVVRVTLQGGQPSYDIVTDQAYDHVAVPDGLDEVGLLYVGSLALRAEQTRATIEHLIATTAAPRFVDINIRQPWFDHAWLPTLLDGARWVKLNEEELGWLVDKPCTSRAQILDAAQVWRRDHGDACLFITCGADGAYAIERDGAVAFAEAPPPDPLADTVGAGDAFASAVIAGLLAGWDSEGLLRAAVRFASRTCSLRGATTDDPNHYLDMSRRLRGDA